MEKINLWKNLTNQYQLSKTLRFELKPIGKTLENIEKNNLIEEDYKKDKDFLKVKKIMDNYYKKFIDNSLNKISIDPNLLEEYKNYYFDFKKNKIDKNSQNNFIKIQIKLRKYLKEEVSKIGYFKYFFKKEFIQKYLSEYLEKEGKVDDLKLVKKFNKWNTYFNGFFKNRENIFSEKEISTSIFYRIVNNNLPKFLENCDKISKLYTYNETEFSFKEVENNFTKELNGKSIKDFFNLNNYNNLLNQKGIDNTNLIIGGNSLEDGSKIKGINELINLFSQQTKNVDIKKNIKKLKLIHLFKQILSDRESNSFIYEVIEDENDLIDRINKFYKNLDFNNFEKNLKKLFINLNDFNLNEIYIKNDKVISDISQELFKDYNLLNSALLEYAKNNLKHLKGKDKFEKWVKNTKYFAIYELEKSLDDYNLKSRLDNKKYEEYLNKIENIKNPICSYFSEFFLFDEKFNNIFNSYDKFNNILTNEFKKTNEKDVEIIKDFLDNLINLSYFLKPLYIDFKNKDKNEKSQIEVLNEDHEFYIEFNKLYEKLVEIIPLYNKIRNFITKKDFSNKKFKLNFQNSTLLNGWDLNKEKDNFSIILKKDNSYYLGIMNSNFNQIFEKYEFKKDKKFYFEKMIYKLLPGPNKMLPKVFFSKKSIDYFSPSKEILDIRNYSTHTKSGNPQKGYLKKDFNLNNCHKMINFFIDSLNKHPEWKNFNFKFKKVEDYDDISKFYKDVSDQGYLILFKKIEENYINKLVDEGKLYLFKIWSKDFSKFSKGKPNLHTMYWKELFSKENLKNIVYKLNGEAEIFYRKASIPKIITHSKNLKILNKDSINKKLESKFNYDLIKDKKYTQDKFLFHCPITLNFKSKKDFYNVSNKINNIIAENINNVNILSIDRGERHLAYYTLLNSKGKIIEQDSFNIVTNKIKNTIRKVNYQDKLNKKEIERDKARKSWKSIENIKELKEGYLSQIIHKISEIVIEKNAIIVFEDLNFGFKRGRFKIEKQVYQKFEKMLIEKLNYLVFKNINKTEIGGVLKAYQLTPLFESFQKIGKQTGIIYYVPANFTSKIDPKTGFINLLYPKYETINQASNFFKKFEYIKYNKEENLFEFNFNYSSFIETMKKDKLNKDNWSIYSNGIKLKQFKNKEKNNNWDTKEENITKNLVKLFEDYNLSYKNNLIEDICKTNNPNFLKTLIYNLKLILQLRNSRIKSNEDYILSCVKDKNGNFFDSRNAKEDEPQDADANGAYNIGLKGVILIDRIKKLKKNEKLDLLIKRNDFINYVINRNQ